MGYCYRIIFLLLLSGANLNPTQSNLSSGSTVKRNKLMYKACKAPEDCDSGYYCFGTRLCTECTDCQLYHRAPGKDCVETPQLCGPCLTGFEPVVLTDNKNKDSCKKSLTTSTQPPPSDNSLYYIISSAMGVSFIIAVISICCFKKMALRCKLEYIKKIIRKDQSEESNNKTCQIPSNTNNVECITENNQSEESKNECHIPSKPNEFTLKEEEQNVQAGIFCAPYYDHYVTPTIVNQPTNAHEPPIVHSPSAPPPYSPRSSSEPPINPVSAGTRIPESTASGDTANSNSPPSENLGQNNLRGASRQFSSMDAHTRFWQNLPHFQIINKVLVSNVNDNSSKNTQNQINEIVSGPIEDNKKALIYKLIPQNNE